jgi:hypothetical protein
MTNGAEVVMLSSVCGRHFLDDCPSCQSAKESNDRRLATRTPAPSSDIEEMVERVQRHIAQMETHPPGGSRELVPLHTIRAVLEARAALTATG